MIYFVSDVHLGLSGGDPAEREERFVRWLDSLAAEDTEALWLLGDIWDFWYEYRDVIPREGARAVAAVVNLLKAGIPVYYVPGNHDIWMYSFWQGLGVKVMQQPQVAEMQGKRLLLGHGDALGGGSRKYNFMLKVFHNRVCQKLFSTLHPWLAFRLGKNWSESNYRRHSGYVFKGKDEPLYKFCREECTRLADAGTPVDYCIFGHFHDSVDMTLGEGAAPRLVVLRDWIGGGVHYASLSGGELTVK